MSNLFKWGKFTSHSGLELDFKIECDALTADDWDCIARIVAKRIKFREVYGIPRGGLPLASALSFFKSKDTDVELVCDDVWTTGRSMEEFRANYPGKREQLVGVVLFSRDKFTPLWVKTVFGPGLLFGTDESRI